MTKIILFVLLNVSVLHFPEQPGIDYKHNRLFRELEKHLGMENIDLVELAVSDEFMPAEPLLGRFFKIGKTDYESDDHYIYVGRVNSCRAGGCSVSLDEEVFGDSEYFDYFILYDTMAMVEIVRVFNYQATHGQEVSARGWLRQFEGYTGDQYLTVGREIDAISGATISAFGITQDIIDITRLLNRMLGVENRKKIAGTRGDSD